MDERIWEGLLSTALAIPDDLEARGLGAPDVAMGGGTVLMMRMHHRLSKDIGAGRDTAGSIVARHRADRRFHEDGSDDDRFGAVWIASVEDKRGRPS